MLVGLLNLALLIVELLFNEMYTLINFCFKVRKS
jgi:hypothetical protein